MADFNSNSPAQRGMEWRPASIRQWRGDSPGKGLLMRMRPAAGTLTNVDLFLSKVVGTPGLAIELINDTGGNGLPYLYSLTGADDSFQSSSNVGGSYTGWTNQAGAAATFTEISDSSNATYHRNTAATPVGSPITEYVGGNYVTTTPITRCAYVSVTSRVQCLTANAVIRLFLRIGGVNYYSPLMGPVRNSVTDYSYTWTINPSTGLPWTYIESDDVKDGTILWGIEMQGAYASTVGAQQFRHYDSYATINTNGTESRLAGFYATNLGVPAGSSKWNEKAWTVVPPGSLVMPGNGWVFVHVYSYQGGDAANSFSIPVLKSATAPQEALTGAAASGEHRRVWETVLGPGGVIVGLSATTVGEMFPVLLEQTGPAINNNSQPYADLPSRIVYTGISNYGGEITTAAATNYAGIRMVLGWQNKSLAPDAPLTVELRHGVGAQTGGGTLDASVQVTAQDLVRNADGTVTAQDFLVKFPSVLALLATTLYTIRLVTTASSGRGWTYQAPAVKSGSLGTGVASGDLTGTSNDGTASHELFNGSANNDGDMAAVLVSPPTGPASLTTLAVAAT